MAREPFLFCLEMAMARSHRRWISRSARGLVPSLWAILITMGYLTWPLQITTRKQFQSCWEMAMGLLRLKKTCLLGWSHIGLLPRISTETATWIWRSLITAHP